MAAQGESLGKRATMVDIAAKANVSQATVSLVLNNAPNVRVSEETRERVKSIAVELGYRKGPSHALPASSARVIGLLIDEVTTTPFAAPLIEGARDEAAQHDCIVAMFCTGGDPELEAAALDVLSSLRLVGVLYSTLITQTVTPPVRLAQIPSILLNCRDKDRKLPSVVPADVTGGYAATQHLIQAGHRRIAHIPGEGWGDAAVDRAKGYREALTSHDIAFDAALVSAMERPQDAAHPEQPPRPPPNPPDCFVLDVQGDGRHFFATIVSAEFDGASRVMRHQKVYRALGDRMREQIHALSMKTLTPAEWASSPDRAAAQHHH